MLKALGAGSRPSTFSLFLHARNDLPQPALGCWQRPARSAAVRFPVQPVESALLDLSIDDLEIAILTSAILERQRDRVTAEWKYRLHGEATDGRAVEVVAKFSPTGKLVMITVYAT